MDLDKKKQLKIATRPHRVLAVVCDFYFYHGEMYVRKLPVPQEYRHQYFLQLQYVGYLHHALRWLASRFSGRAIAPLISSALNFYLEPCTPARLLFHLWSSA